jgi:hypothetical protein
MAASASVCRSVSRHELADHLVVLGEVVDVDRCTQRADGGLDLLGTQIGDGGHLLDGDLLLGQPFDVAELALLGSAGDGHTFAAAHDAADAVYVGLPAPPARRS